MLKKGIGCLLFKRDLRSVYRQLYIDFDDIALLGYWIDDCFYFDLVMPVGLVSAARCCQMITDVINYIFSLEDDFDAVNYIDDFGGVEVTDRAWDAFFKLGQVITDVSMCKAKEKACEPSTCMIFLGLEVNSLLLTLRIPEEKMEEIRQELRRWKLGMDYSLKEMQRLVACLTLLQVVSGQGEFISQGYSIFSGSC